MSKLKGIISAVSGILGGGAKAPKLPDPVVPAIPAPTTPTDTGAALAIGTGDVKNQRVSGRSTKRAASAGSDPLGGLGKSGLNI